MTGVTAGQEYGEGDDAAGADAASAEQAAAWACVLEYKNLCGGRAPAGVYVLPSAAGLRLAGGGERDVMAVAREKSRPEPPLEGAELGRDGGLRHAELRRGARNPAEPGDGLHDPKL